jgi:hypothetical protein
MDGIGPKMAAAGGKGIMYIHVLGGAQDLREKVPIFSLSFQALPLIGI